VGIRRERQRAAKVVEKRKREGGNDGAGPSSAPKDDE
jgi:hypothetical protein